VNFAQKIVSEHADLKPTSGDEEEMYKKLEMNLRNTR